MTHSHILNKESQLSFLLAGKATVTFKNSETGNRYTYKIKECKNNPNMFFISYLCGTDNTSSYRYLGVIDVWNNKVKNVRTTQKSAELTDSPVFKTFKWVMSRIVNNSLPSNIEIWHQGICGKCGRKLTVPESIQTGIGPYCAKLLKY